MSKKQLRSVASSGRAASGAFVSPSGFGGTSSTFAVASSSLSYIAEPPDLSRISDAQLVVSFKNLLKKDSVTKTKALEEIKDYLSKPEIIENRVEDGLLEAWVNLYPRTSIDTSRRVRQLAHALQGSLGLLCGKRILKYMPKIVGAWIAGQYDKDHLVSRAAQESLAQVFAAEEKRRTVWRAYRSAILGYVDDAAIQQTAQTLSDERTVSPDDALAKHVRVAASAIFILGMFINEPKDNVSDDDRAMLEGILRNKKIWDYASHSDPYLRRAVLGLLHTYLRNGSFTLDLGVVSTAIISKALHTSQMGSALDFSESLVLLTELHPDVWTDRYSGKVPAAKRLRQYLKKGSQLGPPQCWTNMARVLSLVPTAVLSLDPDPEISSSKLRLEEAEGLANCLVEGITQRDEPRSNLGAAWSAYVDTSLWMSSQLDGQKDVDIFLTSQLAPLLSQYVRPAKATSQWLIHSLQASKICAECLSKIALSGETLFDRFWTSVSESVIEDMRTSLPAQSKSFRDSQDAVATCANRYFSFEKSVLTTEPADVVTRVFSQTAMSLLESAIQLLNSRNGKPYGSAAVIESAIRNIPQLIFQSPSGADMIRDFLRMVIPSLVKSPSSDLLVSILIDCKGRRGYDEGISATVEAFLADDISQRLPGFLRILSQVEISSLSSFEQVQAVIRDDLGKALNDSHSAIDHNWDQVAAFLGNPSVPISSAEGMINSIVERLVLGENVEGALAGLEIVSRDSKPKIKEYVTTSEGSKLLSRLILLSESPDEETARRANTLQFTIKSLLAEQGGANLTAKSTIEIIEHNLQMVDDNSLSIDTIVEQAKAVLSEAPSDDKSSLAHQICPSRELWENVLRPFLDIPPSKAMAITNPLGGAINIVKKPEQGTSELRKIPFDSNFLSPAARLTIFVLRLLADLNVLSLIDSEQRESLFLYFPLAIQLIDDNLTIAGANQMWNLYADEIENEMSEVVFGGRQLMARWIEALSQPVLTDYRRFGEGLLVVWEGQLDHIKGSSPYAFHLGRTYARILSEIVDATGTSKYASAWKEWMSKIRMTTEVIYAAAILAAFKNLVASAPEGRRLNNELIADLTGLNAGKGHDEILRKLVLFNILVQGDTNLLEEVPKPRLVFFVKHLIEWLEGKESRLPLAIQAEALKALNLVLPFIKDIYGSHWEDILFILETVVDDSASEECLQLTHAFLKMITTLRLLYKDESNDDLKDNWEVWSGPGLSLALVNVLHSFHQPEYHVNQPRGIVTDALARQVALTELKCNEEEVNNTYGLLRAESRGVQKAASTLISQYLPEAQETLSVELGASGGIARLPDELLSLLLETPSMDSLARGHSEERMWLNIRGYLLSWRTLFDHFTTASHKVKTDYVDSIKDGDYLPNLLTFTFDFLGHAAGKPLDASKFPITSYTLDSQETFEKDIQSLTIHLYYLCLVHLPIITKTWWIDSKKRVKAPIEIWTQKFISPHVTTSAFKAVSDWELETTADTEQDGLEIKISPKASELTASIDVNEGGDSPPISIAISLPPAYPLQPAVVVGRQRVVVDEKKWRSWLLTIQGVIMFHGNLADGLMAFRKNVQGALKGQSECAICYSIISTNMQTPSKRCGTCQNMFHSTCLFRWFRSSNSSSCPLCRNNFNYG